MDYKEAFFKVKNYIRTQGNNLPCDEPANSLVKASLDRINLYMEILRDEITFENIKKEPNPWVINYQYEKGENES